MSFERILTDMMGNIVEELELINKRISSIEKRLREQTNPRFDPRPSIYPPGPGPGISQHKYEPPDYVRLMQELQGLRKRLEDDKDE